MTTLRLLKALLMINILGLDPSLRSWGMAGCAYDINGLKVLNTRIIKTKNTKSKTVKQNYSDIQSANELYLGLIDAVKSADLICIEVPHGSQSSRAATSYGVCVALIGVIHALNPNIIQVSANDVKAIVRTDKSHKPTKQEIIDWVKDKHPEANLPTSLSAEHICDAIVAVYAAMNTKEFKEKYEY